MRLLDRLRVLFLALRRMRKRQAHHKGGVHIGFVIANIGEGEYPLVEDHDKRLWLIHATGSERVNGLAGAVNIARRWDTQGGYKPPLVEAWEEE